MYIPFDKKIALLDDDKAPITKITAMLGFGHTKGPKFAWTEDELCAKSDVTDAAEGAADTSISVEHAEYFRNGDVVKVPSTGEVMIVTADGAAAGDLTVTRAVGATSASNIASGAELLIISNHNMEGADTRTLLSTQTVTVYNYCQIIRTPFGVTGTLNASEMVDQPDLPYLRKKMLIEHVRQIEFATIWGERGTDTTGGDARRRMGGILERISTNWTVLASPGYLTKTVFTDWLRTVFRYGSGRRYVFGSALCMGIINQFAEKQLTTNQGAKKYGLNIQTYVTPYGTVELVMHKEFEGSTYGGMMIALDFADGCVGFKNLRATRLLPNRHGNGEDKIVDEYFTEGGSKLKAESRHGVMLGVTA